jgi:Ras-related protein Rab-11A
MRSEEAASLTATVVLIGSMTVGKTAIANALLNKAFSTDWISTVGGASLTLTYDDNGISKDILIWDTAGQEQYRALGPMYYHGSAAAVCVYDISKRESFADVHEWITAYRNAVGEGPAILLIGNKIDLPNRAVSTAEGEELAKEKGYRFLETSAKSGTNIDLIVPELKTFTRGSAHADARPHRESSRCC